MPESPEVSFLCNQLLALCKGRSLESVDILRGRYKKHGAPANFQKFKGELPLKLLNIEQKGKMMILHFEHDWTIISKLGLMGWWFEVNDPPQWMKTPHNIMFNFKGKTIVYTDLLSYGTLTLTNDNNAVQKQLDAIAPDVRTIQLKEMRERLNSKPRLLKERIEDVLIDQKALFSGVGNYLKSEVLYQAKISPLRKVSSLTEHDLRAILINTKKVIKRQERVVSHTNVDKYMENMRVYRKNEDHNGNRVKSHKTKDGRTTYWVPAVQT